MSAAPLSVVGAQAAENGHELETFELDQRMCKAYVSSGLFADLKDKNDNPLPQEVAVAAAYVKVSLGRAIGVNPVVAMQGIHIIKGRPSVGYEIRAERMRAYGYNYEIVEQDNTHCTLEISRHGQPLGLSDFSIEDARRAGLIKGGGAYEKTPRNMMFARALTNAQRWFAPEALGGVALPTPEEAETITVEVEDPQKAITGSISLDDLKPSDDKNRGHDQTAPTSAEGDNGAHAATGASAIPPSDEASDSVHSSGAPVLSDAAKHAIDKRAGDFGMTGEALVAAFGGNLDTLVPAVRGPAYNSITKHALKGEWRRVCAWIRATFEGVDPVAYLITFDGTKESLLAEVAKWEWEQAQSPKPKAPRFG